MEQILSEMRKELISNVDKKYKDGAERYFKEKIICYGVRTPIVRRLGKKYFNNFKHLPKKDIFLLCEELFKSGLCEESTIAAQWVFRLKSRFESEDFILFERWISLYLDNWAKIDDFCSHPMNHLITVFPKLIPKVKAWSKSGNMWMRRASAVSFISGSSDFYSKNLCHVFDVAGTLLKDKEDLVQKGYGWMLKVAANFFQKDVFDFVMKNKKLMPRTALRYAIEKMPANLKNRAMDK